MENIEQLRDKNLRELTTLEAKKKQLGEELRATLTQLGLAEMPSQEFIDDQIKNLRAEVTEKENNLHTLLTQYSAVVEAENATITKSSQSSLDL